MLFAASTPFAKLLLGDGLDPWLLAGLLYLGAGLGLGTISLARWTIGGAPTEPPLRRADLPWLAAVIVAGGVVGPVLLMLGLSAIPAATASLLLNLEGLLTMGIAWVAFRENVDRRLLLGAAAILSGAALLSWRGGPLALAPGALAIAGACAAWALDNNLTRKLAAADPVQIALMKGLVAGSVNLALAITVAGARLPGWRVLGGAALVGFFGYGLSLIFFVLALRHLGAARTSAYFSTAPFIGAGLALAILDEQVGITFLVAGLLMALGVAIHLAEIHEHEHAHGSVEHEHRHIHDSHHHHLHAPTDPPGEPHSHRHRHAPIVHTHPHYPDLHHRHRHRHIGET